MGSIQRRLGRGTFERDAARLRTQVGSTGGGSGGAPDDAQYLTLATHADLTAERVFTDGDGIVSTDAGAGSTLTVAVDLVAAWSGLEFNGGDLRTDLGAAFAWTNDHSWASSVSTKPILTIENTNADAVAPSIDFYKNSASPADGDDLGRIDFYGEDSVGAKERYAYILGESLDVTSGDTGGGLDFRVVMLASERSLLQLKGYNGATNQGEVIVNEGGEDVDFRVEASGVADALQVRGSDGQITLGALGAGYVSADAGGVLSSAGLPGSFTGFANPTASVGLSAVNGAATTAMRSDGAPALDQGIVPTWTGVHTFQNTGLHILDTNGSHDLIIAPGSDLTADRTLTLTTGNASRTITLSGNPTLGDWFDQSVKQAASPTFADVFVPDGGTFGITGNELLTVNAAGTFAFSGIGGVSVENGDWIGAGSGCAWLYDSGNGDISTTANVGIGIAAPETKTHIVSTEVFSVTLLNDTLMLKAGDNAGGAGSFGASIGFNRAHSLTRRTAAIAAVQTSADADQMGLAFFTHPTAAGDSAIVEQVRITHDGNVVIGATSALAKLHVDQYSSSGAIPAMLLDQGDTTEQHIVCSMDGADRDFPNILQLDVTGNPALWWDESVDAFGFKNVSGLLVESGDWVGAGAACAWLFDSANVDITTGALVGMGTGVPANPVAQLHVVGAVAAGLPVLLLNQPDNSEEYIDYLGNSAASVANPISTWTTGNSIQGFVRIGINGAFFWAPYYDAPTA